MFRQIWLISRRMCEIISERCDARIADHSPFEASMFRASKFPQMFPKAHTIYIRWQSLTLNLKILHKELRTHTFTKGLCPYISIKKPFYPKHSDQMAWYCDAPTLPANSRNRLYECMNKNCTGGFPGCMLGYWPFQPSTHFTLNDRSAALKKNIYISRNLWC